MERNGNTDAFVARYKLGQLRDQRDALRQRYEAIEREADACSDPAQRVRLLYEGLSQVRLAGEPVHPELPDLSLVLRSLQPDSAAVWERRLRQELARGRARSEAVYAYGSLLEEDLSAGPSPEPALDLSAFAAATGAAPGDAPAAAAADGPLAEVLADEAFARHLPETREAFALGLGVAQLSPEALAGAPEAPPDGHCIREDLYTLLTRIASDPERHAALRAEAERHAATADDPAGQGLRRAMLAALADAVHWRWPETGVTPRRVQTGDRVRVHPTLSLVDTLMVEQIGEWLAGALPSLYTGHVNRRRRLARLQELQAPEAIIDHERHLLDAPLGVLDDPRVLDEAVSAGSVLAHLDLGLAGLWSRSTVPGAAYGYGGGADVVRLLDALLATRRAAGVSTVVVRTDVAGFYDALDHRLLLRYLEQVGMPEDWRAFVEAFLRVPWRVDDRVVEAQRGVPLSCRLSRVLADAILGAGELYVRRRAKVLTIRLVDDLTIVAEDAHAATRAWDAWRQWLDACGLQIQPAKTGAVGVHGAVAPAVPPGPVRYGLLALTESGWRVDDEALGQLAEQTRARLQAAPSMLRAARAWADQVGFFVEALVCDTALQAADATTDHAEQCVRAGRRFAAALDETGVEGWFSERIAARTGYTPTRAWLRWPVTAGGLSLRDPMIPLCSIQPRRPELPEPGPDMLTTRDDWGRAFAALGEPAKPQAPRTDAIGQARVADFIARGTEVSGGQQEGLRPYWRWVLAAHGDDILETFGTFRFLSQHLVPRELAIGGDAPGASETMPSSDPP